MNQQDENYINCPICGELSISTPHTNTLRVKCPICKQYNIGDAFYIPELKEEELIKLRYFYYTLAENDSRRLEPINNENKEEFLSKIISPKTLLDKINNLILYLSDNTKYLGEPISISGSNGYRRFFCKNNSEFRNVLKVLKKRGYITPDSLPETQVVSAGQPIPDKIITVTTECLEFAETLFNNINSKQCFVAMWFDDSTNELYQKIYKAVTGNPNLEKDDENYGANYNIMKIDDKHHTNYIPAEIISEIKRSRFMIADLTGYRGGVYYEAGFAEGLGIPVILTCHETWFNEQKDTNEKIIHNGVHFDLRQKNILFWTEEKLEQFKRNLVARIGEVVGFNKT